MINFSKQQSPIDMLTSRLFNQDGFYNEFIRDLRRARQEVIIESPFLSPKRIKYLLPTLTMLKKHKIEIFVNTKPVDEQESEYQNQASLCVELLQITGARVLYTGGHHRKIAIIDRHILYEGSLNILSQNDSCEIMRRIDSEPLAQQMVDFIGLDKFTKWYS